MSLHVLLVLLCCFQATHTLHLSWEDGTQTFVDSTHFSDFIGPRNYTVSAEVIVVKSVDACHVKPTHQTLYRNKIVLFDAYTGCFAVDVLRALQGAGAVGAIHIAQPPFKKGLMVYTRYNGGENVRIPTVEVQHNEIEYSIQRIQRGISAVAVIDSNDDHTTEFRSAFGSLWCVVLCRGGLVLMNTLTLVVGVVAVVARFRVRKATAPHHSLRKSRFVLWGDLAVFTVVVELVGCVVRLVVCEMGPFLTAPALPFQSQVALIDVSFPMSLFGTAALGVMVQRLVNHTPGPLSTQQGCVLWSCGIVSIACIFASVLRPFLTSYLFSDITLSLMITTLFHAVMNVVCCVYVVASALFFSQRYRRVTLWRLNDLFSESQHLHFREETARSIKYIGMMIGVAGVCRAVMVGGAVVLLSDPLFTPAVWLSAMSLLYYGATISSLAVVIVIQYFSSAILRGTTTTKHRHHDNNSNNSNNPTPHPSPLTQPLVNNNNNNPMRSPRPSLSSSLGPPRYLSLGVSGGSGTADPPPQNSGSFPTAAETDRRYALGSGVKSFARSARIGTGFDLLQYYQPPPLPQQQQQPSP